MVTPKKIKNSVILLKVQHACRDQSRQKLNGNAYNCFWWLGGDPNYVSNYIIVPADNAAVNRLYLSGFWPVENEASLFDRAEHFDLLEYAPLVLE